jgi:TetR/AcrR family transcriptional regulator, cholesterol catabolism regulator
MSGVEQPEPRRAARKPRGEARRALILMRAGELFDRQGVAHTSIEEIASAASVTREAVYYYFADKIEILIEIILPESISLDAGLKRIIDLKLPLRDKLVLAVENHIYRFNPNYFEMVVSVRRMSRMRPDPRITGLLEVWRTYQNRWITLVRDGQATGEIAALLDARITAFAILGMCNSPSIWFRPTEPYSLENLAENLVHLVLGGALADD